MINITEVLTTEHAVFCHLFELMEGVLPKLETVTEVRLLSGLVAGLLHDHGEAEASLAYYALDHVLADRGELDHMHHDHQELDARLKRAQAASDPAEARRLLQAALCATREHFRHEEQIVFPLVDRVLQKETLEELGRAWGERRSGLASQLPEVVFAHRKVGVADAAATPADRTGNQQTNMSALTIEDLASQVCVPCKGGVPPLKGTALRSLVQSLGHQWKAVRGHHLEKEFKFKDFREALAFANKVGELAEAQGHHPDIHLAWGRVKVTIWTHKIDGLTANDFVLAARIEQSQ